MQPEQATRLVTVAAANQPGAGNDFATFTAASPYNRATLRIAVSLASTLTVKFAGGTALKLNNGTPLLADTLYQIALLIDPIAAETVAFQIDTAGLLRTCVVDGAPGGG